MGCTIAIFIRVIEEEEEEGEIKRLRRNQNNHEY
jgi:hypothetical protein